MPTARPYRDHRARVRDAMKDPALCDLRTVDRLTLLAILNLCSGSLICRSRIATITRICGRDRRNIRRSINRLIAAGWVTRTPRPGYSSILSLTIPGQGDQEAPRQRGTLAAK